MVARRLPNIVACGRLSICIAAIVSSNIVLADDEPQPKMIIGALKSDTKKADAKRVDVKKQQEQMRQQQQAAIEAQYKVMGKMMLASELNFVRASCEVPADQRANLKEAGQKSLDESIKKLAEMHVRPLPASQRKFPSPVKSLRETLQTELKRILSPEEFAKFESESTKRYESLKHTTIDMIVSRIDQRLWLSAKQRAAITESLNSHWGETSDNWIIVVNYDSRTFPTLPDNAVVPHLTERQKSAWNKTQKVETSSTLFLNGNWGGLIEEAKDDYWGSENKSPIKEDESAKPVGFRSLPDKESFG